MPDLPHPAVAVALPGTGSDAHFARRAFGSACAALDIPFHPVDPDPRRVIDSYHAALDAAARSGPVLIAGVSLGAAVAVEWAARHPDSVYGVVAALPAWTGADTTGCPAALSAAATASALRADGIDAVIEGMRASSPAWLAEALTRSWRSQWPDLPSALDEAAAYRWPEAELLSSITVPVSLVGAIDDPVHPFGVAERWADLIPDSELHHLTLDELGSDPAILGQRGFRTLVPRRIATP
ncbi:alpha/beta hydrolase [Nocardia sp. NBC_01503]|uniref:alpha/beta fold hydrolase n=1 Tax=Nocardia sp. NBC_01503 TaxID=2975997 RepID=UPI002E7AD2F7|nr:alpha/beta hydrolase [Nocardia sp. NBC_01503]WTL30058.1 alpha/beta hydrolase [Nocardia sp. NBC_01503]